MKVTYRSSVEDEVRMHLKFLETQGLDRGFRREMVGWMVLIGLSVALVLLDSTWIVFVGVFVAVMILLRVARPMLIRQKLRRLVRQQRDGQEWVRYSTTLNESGSVTEGGGITVTIGWAGFKSIEQTEDHLFLLFTHGLTSIPRRDPQSEELEAFVACAQDFAERFKDPAVIDSASEDG